MLQNAILNTKINVKNIRFNFKTSYMITSNGNKGRKIVLPTDLTTISTYFSLLTGLTSDTISAFFLYTDFI